MVLCQPIIGKCLLPGHVGLGVVPGQGGEVNACDCSQEPGCLPLLLHCPPGAQGRGSPGAKKI